ncbi:MAG: glycosyltransferase family 39 protein [Anaeromyxobacteraceae bacterium]
MTPERRPPWNAVLALAALAAGARALAFAGTDLYADEAYYWLWSLRPAAGYFDHPPLVAWLIALSAPLVRGELGVRLLFVVAGALTVVFAALLARELSPEPRAPLLGALLAAAAPLLSVLGALALPDAPVAAAYTAALWLLARAQGRRWVLAGVAVGVALLAKYSAALLAPALLLLVAWDAELRRELRTPWPWLGGAVAVAIFAPCLLWNARHDWVSLRFQLGHGFAANATLRSLAEYVVGQLAGAGPVALVAGGAFLFGARSSAAKRVAAGVLLPLAVTTYSAFRGRVEANWPALVYPALAAAAGAALARSPAPRRARALALGSLALTALLLAGFAIELRHPRLLAGTLAVERFHGWRDAAAEVRALTVRGCAEVGCDAKDPFTFAVSYQVASELAFYGGFRRLGPASERRSQLDLWDERPAPGEAFLFVGSADGVPDAFRREHDASGEGAAGRFTVRFGGAPLRSLSVTPFAHFAGRAPGE